jgi:hypothetical protein
MEEDEADQRVCCNVSRKDSSGVVQGELKEIAEMPEEAGAGRGWRGWRG